MLVFCHVSYGPPYGSGGWGSNSDYQGWAFNTDTLAMQQVSSTWRGALLEPVPANVYLADGAIIHTTCAGTTATVYRYKRVGETFTTSQEVDSPFCGYTPPDTRTCTIIIDSVTVVDDRATVNCTGYIGPLEYSLDGGNMRQLSPLFADLSAGDYVATVYDRGATLPGCHSTQAFSVAASEPENAPRARIRALPSFCFAGNPIMLTVFSPVAFQPVIIQLYVEDAHRSGLYKLAFDAQRRTDGSATTSFDVSDILRGHLRPELRRQAGYGPLSTPIRNWFVRVARVLPQTGRPGNWTTSTNSVVLLGGLAAEPMLARRGYWNRARLFRRFHTWQPLRKQVGRRHREVLQLLLNDNDPFTVQVRAYDAAGNLLPAASTSYAQPAAPAWPTLTGAAAPPNPSSAQRVRLFQLVLDLGGLAATVAQLRITAERVNRTPYAPPGGGAIVDPPPTPPLDSFPLVLDVMPDAEPRQLVFENSLGSFDTIALFGKLTTKTPRDAGSVQVLAPLAPGLASTVQERSWPGGLPVATTYSCSTGWLSAEALEYLQELLQPGREVYEWEQGQLRPVLLTTKELVTYTEVDDQRAAVIDYRPAITNEFFTDYARSTNRDSAIGAGWE